ncbi:TELO2-interacting protein 1 homolog isoform X2 [Anabrus simplex]
MVADVPEELKLSIVKCSTELLHQITVNIIQQLYKSAHAPQLSQGIYICVQIMQNEKLRSLRAAAISFIMTIAQVHDGSKVISSGLRHQVAEMLMFVLPGILTGLHKVAIGDDKQGHRVTFMALRAWSKIVVLMIEDDAITKELPPPKLRIVAKVSDQLVPVDEPGIEIKDNDSKQNLMRALENQIRSPQWVADIVQKVAVLLESFTPLQQHAHWKVRLELAASYHLLLEKCLRNLRPVAMTIVDVLLKLSDDPIEQVSCESKKAVELLSKRLKEESDTSLLEILEENFYNLITKLPRILRGNDDGEKLAELSLLAVYLQLLGADKLPHMLSSACHLQRLIRTLIQIVEMETVRVCLLEDSSLRELDQSICLGLNKPWKQFKHFMNPDILLKIQTICQLLGQFGDLGILSDYLLDLLYTDISHRSEIVLIMNEILAGASPDQCVHTVNNVLDVYLESSLWYLPLSVQEDSITIGQAQSNLVLSCLLVEGIGKMAHMLGSKFNQFLLRTLYVVMERAGSTHKLLALAGTMAAMEIACAGGYGSSIACLLTANMDYFSFHVTIKLRKVDRNPGVLDVLSLAMRHSNKEMLPSLQTIVDDVLLQSCDSFQDRHALSFLQVFYTFFVSIRKWLGDEDSSQQPCRKEVKSSTSIVESIVKYHENKLLSDLKIDVQSAEGTSPDSESELMAELNEDDGNKTKPKVPSYVEMTEAILKRCLHFLPSKDKQCKLLALETLQAGLLILAKWEDQLLPVVHLIWSPLIGRFEDASDPLILSRSFSLLHTMACLAKNFIRSRTLQNVLPQICQFLSRSANESQHKGMVPAYCFTQVFKLQCELLDKLGDLAVDLHFQEKEMYQVLNASSPYLSQLQPPLLQEFCIKLFRTIAISDQDCVWLEVTRILSQVSTTGNPEFKKNVDLLLQSLQ